MGDYISPRILEFMNDNLGVISADTTALKAEAQRYPVPLGTGSGSGTTAYDIYDFTGTTLYLYGLFYSVNCSHLTATPTFKIYWDPTSGADVDYANLKCFGEVWYSGFIPFPVPLKYTATGKIRGKSDESGTNWSVTAYGDVT